MHYMPVGLARLKSIMNDGTIMADAIALSPDKRVIV